MKRFLIPLLPLIVFVSCNTNYYKSKIEIAKISTVASSRDDERTLVRLKKMYLSYLDSIKEINKTIVVDSEGKRSFHVNTLECELGMADNIKKINNDFGSDTVIWIRYYSKLDSSSLKRKITDASYLNEMLCWGGNYSDFSSRDLKFMLKIGCLCNIVPVLKRLRPENFDKKAIFATDSIDFQCPLTSNQKRFFRTLINNSFVCLQATTKTFNSEHYDFNYYPNYRGRNRESQNDVYVMSFHISENIPSNQLIVDLTYKGEELNLLTSGRLKRSFAINRKLFLKGYTVEANDEMRLAVSAFIGQHFHNEKNKKQ